MDRKLHMPDRYAKRNVQHYCKPQLRKGVPSPPAYNDIGIGKLERKRTVT